MRPVPVPPGLGAATEERSISGRTGLGFYALHEPAGGSGTADDRRRKRQCGDDELGCLIADGHECGPDPVITWFGPKPFGRRAGAT